MEAAFKQDQKLNVEEIRYQLGQEIMQQDKANVGVSSSTINFRPMPNM